MQVHRIFTAHPASVGESYREHFAVASRFALELAKASAACAAHAFVPGCCTTTASSKVIALHDAMTSGARAPRTSVLDTRAMDVSEMQTLDDHVGLRRVAS